MKAKDIHQHFMDVAADWVNPAKTVDGIIIGDPEKEIRTVGVTWISSFDAVREAAAQGLDLLVTHEPTFWAHFDELKTLDKWPLSREKKAFIEEKGLVILRCHDVWDRMPKIGIPWAWARFLGFDGQPAADGWRNTMYRYDIDPVTVDGLAARVVSKISALGEDTVQVVGDSGRSVSRVGIGTGCIGVVTEFMEMGCDAAIVTDDGSLYWRQIQYAQDAGLPVIRVNHGTAEEPGMATLAQYLRDTFPDLQVTHLPHRCSYHIIENKI